MIDYNDRIFRPMDAADGSGTLARYHQNGEVVWAEFGGGEVHRGSLAGRCQPDGTLSFAYCMVLAGGQVVSGHCTSTPVRLDDGRIRLNEQWQRFAPTAETGTSAIEEVPAPAQSAP